MMGGYPAPAYPLIGSKHEAILQKRLEKLPEAAEKFYKLLQLEIE